MSNTPNLLPCPFCGGMATAKPIDLVPGWHHVTVLHSDCFYKPAQDQMLLNDEHLAAWNRRTPQPVVREPELDQFLSDVMTAAGLVTHGKQCKQLGERLGAAVMKLRVHNIPQKGCD